MVPEGILKKTTPLPLCRRVVVLIPLCALPALRCYPRPLNLAIGRKHSQGAPSFQQDSRREIEVLFNITVILAGKTLLLQKYFRIERLISLLSLEQC